MAELIINVNQQLLSIQNQEIISSGDINYDTCLFEFDPTWDGFIRTAVFYQKKEKLNYAVLDEHDRCTIPASAMMLASPMFIGVFGINGEKVLTSTVERINIVEGAVTGDEIDLEPPDNIFLAIVAQYQDISRKMDLHNQKTTDLQADYDELEQSVAEELESQNTRLEALGAFDTEKILDRLDEVQATTNGFKMQVDEVLERFTVLRNVSIQFIEGSCTITSEHITESALCDVYFDEYSYEYACNAPMLVSSFNGYLTISTSVEIKEILTADIVIRRFE